MVAPLSTASPVMVKEPLPRTDALNCTCVPVKLVLDGKFTGLL